LRGLRPIATLLAGPDCPPPAALRRRDPARPRGPSAAPYEYLGRLQVHRPTPETIRHALDPRRATGFATLRCKDASHRWDQICRRPTLRRHQL